MKRLVMAAFFLVVASMPVYATTIDCYSYYDNLPYQDDDFDFCYYAPWNICFECVDVSRGTGCAGKRLCNPDATIIRVPKEQLIQLSPAKNTSRVQVAGARRGHPSRSGNSNSIRPVTVRVARLNAGSLL